MRKFYETKEFQKLNDEWKARLKDDGFVDLEDQWGFIKWDGCEKESLKYWERVRDFYMKMGFWVTNQKKLPRKHRKVLTLLCDGKSPREIGESLKMPRVTVNKIFQRYRERVLKS
jgi:hypothetical protein